MEEKANIRSIVYSDHSTGSTGDFPVCIKYIQHTTFNGQAVPDVLVVDPVYTDALGRNLFGRIMTLVEATTDSYKLKAVKDLFGKEIRDWEHAMFNSAREIAEGGDSSANLYSRIQ